MEPIIERLLKDRALDEAKRAEGAEIAEGAGLPLVRVLLHMKLVDPKAVVAAISAVTGRPLLNLDRGTLPASPVPYFPAGLCRELRVLPLAYEKGEEGTQLVLAMSDPTDEKAGERVAAHIGKSVRPVLVDDAALSRAIAKRYDEAPAVALLVAPEVLLVDEVLGDPTDEVAIDFSSDVFFQGVNTAVMKAAPTTMGRNPFQESEHSQTEATSVLGTARVCFVSRDMKARLRVAADLAPLVLDAYVVDDLKVAVDYVEREPVDEVVVHGPKNDAGTGLLLDRLARGCEQGIVVISNDASFAELPCVRRRLRCRRPRPRSHR